ncbi:MAG TPA: zinc-dependent peptidase [Niabella sp.]|nr:zinc-dependent peptidase [Niabella sp.]
MQVIFPILLIVFFVGIIFLLRKKKNILQPDVSVEKKLLQHYVPFYQKLNEADKAEFSHRVQLFLSKVRITGIDTLVEDIDRIFVAAGSVIPVFVHKNWEYSNIEEVLIYPGSFNNNFQLTGEERNILGMVGDGALQNQMILSQQDLRNGFLHDYNALNTVIHEFVHLIDKMDGAIDGIPELLLPQKLIKPWIQIMEKETETIKQGQSEINPYGATKKAEFLSVVSEYYFKLPELLQLNHPELFSYLDLMYKGENKKTDIQKNRLDSIEPEYKTK